MPYYSPEPKEAILQKMARLDGYVYRLQTQEKHPDTRFVQIVVRFVDDDPQKLADLSHFIARFQG